MIDQLEKAGLTERMMHIPSRAATSQEVTTLHFMPYFKSIEDTANDSNTQPLEPCL